MEHLISLWDGSLPGSRAIIWHQKRQAAMALYRWSMLSILSFMITKTRKIEVVEFTRAEASQNVLVRLQFPF